MKNIDDHIEKFMKAHGTAKDCLICTFLEETGYSAKDVKIVEKRCHKNGTWSFQVAHKNTPNKYL